MTLIAVCITLIYLCLIGSLIYGFGNIKDFFLQDLKPKTKFSVVIPFRNEARNLPALLESIVKLNYLNELFEIIFVDDDSLDASVDIINQMTSHFPQMDIRLIKNARNTSSPKKDAITTAISLAKYDWIVTTDADCLLPKFWLDSFDEYIQQQNPEFIVAPVTYSKMATFLDHFQLLDMLSLQGSTIGGFGVGKPFLCNGANLAYTKQLFKNVNGFQGNSDIGSGDDIFMLEKAVKNKMTRVGYLKCEQTIVITLSQPSVDALISQRVRWAAKASGYQNLFAKLVGIIVFLMNGGLLVFGLMTFIGIIKINIFIYLLVIKFGVDLLLIYKTATFMNEKEVLKTYLFAFFLYPFFSVYVVFVSVFKGYKWKGRDYIK